jgi:hypothetical protein
MLTGLLFVTIGKAPGSYVNSIIQSSSTDWMHFLAMKLTTRGAAAHRRRGEGPFGGADEVCPNLRPPLRKFSHPNFNMTQNLGKIYRNLTQIHILRLVHKEKSG